MWEGWQDYTGIIPGVAATLMGLVTLVSREMPRWKKAIVLVLTIIAIGGTGFSQWWTVSAKKGQEVRRAEILETLGKFIDEGQALMNAAASPVNEPAPVDEINDWGTRTQNFLVTLGPSYVTRFRSGAGLETSLSPNGVDQSKAAIWRSMRAYLSRLHEFSTEFAGQVPQQKAPSNLF